MFLLEKQIVQKLSDFTIGYNSTWKKREEGWTTRGTLEISRWVLFII